MCAWPVCAHTWVPSCWGCVLYHAVCAVCPVYPCVPCVPCVPLCTPVSPAGRVGSSFTLHRWTRPSLHPPATSRHNTHKGHNTHAQGTHQIQGAQHTHTHKVYNEVSRQGHKSTGGGTLDFLLFLLCTHTHSHIAKHICSRTCSVCGVCTVVCECVCVLLPSGVTGV